jgi:tRNA(Ile)-lysidine synthase
VDISFEQKVRKSFTDAAIDIKNIRKIGVAVSGGADSVSLLISLSNIFLNTKTKIFVITVNHFIREEKETTGDALFVEEICNQLKKEGRNLEFKLYALKKGMVASYEKENHCGTEAAARDLRYECFERFIKENNLEYLCLAHNQNDQLETLLMRFLQGSQTENSTGIKLRREKYLRPLLGITRKEIEQYLKEKKISYRIDSTNSDTSYLRNKIRLNLIPVLDKNFPGWKNALLTGAEKNQEDAELIQSMISGYKIVQKKDEVLISRKDFHNAKKAVKRRLILSAIDSLVKNYRVPSAFIWEVIRAEDEALGNKILKETGIIQILINKENLLIRKNIKKNTDSYFSVIIEEDSEFDLPFARVLITTKGKKDGSDRGVKGTKIIQINGIEEECNIEYPFIFRSFQSDDYVKTADNKKRKILKIFSDWHITEESREMIPLIQEIKTSEQEIKCILGKPFGFYNWIVKDDIEGV